MIKIIFFILFLQCAQIVFSQTIDPFPYKFSSTIYEKIKSDSASWRGGVTSSDLSFIGLYKEALQEWDMPRPYRKKISQNDSLDFVQTYKPNDARKYILKKAKENRVLIFNEAHYNPRNRVFVTSILKELKKLGYTFFAAETFSIRQNFQENSRYPNLNSGYYTMEPQFGNLLREANKLKLSLYPYEYRGMGSQQERETGEAQNLAKLLDSIPNCKIIVYCGFSHIGEDTIANWAIPMAAKLKKLSGIDPYTIEQTILSERLNKVLNNPYYKIINYDNYAILSDKKGNSFNKKLDDKRVDAYLYTPPTKYIHNRPGWIFENGKQPYFMDKDSVQVSFPLLAKVYFKEKDIEDLVIPIDIIEIRSAEELTQTALSVYKRKKFIVQLVDMKGASQIVVPK